MRFVDRREFARNAFEERALFGRPVLQFLGLLLRFDGFPILDDFIRGRGRFGSEHVGMPAYQLLADFVDNGIDVELTGFFSKIGVENHVKEQIA